MAPTDLEAALHERLDGRSPDEQKFLFVATLNEHLPQGRTVLVGGSLVELLTVGAVTSLEVDLVADTQAVAKLLKEVGLQEEALSL